MAVKNLYDQYTALGMKSGKDYEIIMVFRADGAQFLLTDKAYDLKVKQPHPKGNANKAMIEAMHAGVPVISTQVRTFPELIVDGVNGFLVPTKNSHALAEAIRLLAGDPDLEKKMGLANHLKGREFRADVVVSQMLKIVFPG